MLFCENCHMEVLDSLKAFGNDWKLCWLACSALIKKGNVWKKNNNNFGGG